MLHLLPIRLILTIFVVVALVSFAGFTGWFGSVASLGEFPRVVRWAGALVTGGIIFLFAAWRWFSFAQAAIFPYLGGSWTGTLAFKKDGVAETREATLQVKHSLAGIVMILETDESISWTLVVHADKDRHFEQYRLYYAYLNERKEGTEGAGDRYRGLAILRIEKGRPLAMAGNYFTDRHRSGTLRLTQTSPNPWWKLWR